MSTRFFHRVAPLLGLVVFTIALFAIHHALKEYRYQDIRQAFQAIPTRNVLGALAITAFGYFMLSCYDLLSFRYIRKSLPIRKITFVSFTGHALSNNVGYSFLSGGSVRFRLYSGWGLDPVDIAKIIAFSMLTGWVAFTTVGGIACVCEPHAIPKSSWFPLTSVRPIGIILLASVFIYLSSCLILRKPIRIKGRSFELPPLPLALVQVVVGILDMGATASVLYMLLPQQTPLSYFALVGIFVIAIIIGLISQVPGGLGVFETVIVFLLAPWISPPETLGALVAFRVIYYFLPLLVAALLISAYELRARRDTLYKVTNAVYATLTPLAPQALALLVFSAGAVLLFSGATPAIHGRMNLLKPLVPLPVIETSHFLGSIAGLGLILLARALQRRLDAAYWLALVFLAGGACFSLLKGLDYEEAVILAVLFAALLPCRKHFYRKASLFAPQRSVGWAGAIVAVLACSVWLGFFAHKHVEYTQELWWRFSASADASRFLRATVGMFVLLAGVGVGRLLRPAPAAPEQPTLADLDHVAGIVASHAETYANLALLGDKTILFNDQRNAFIMYRVEGRSWVAMGDPVGPEGERNELIWQYRELCHRYDGWPVFYQVAASNVPLYADSGFALLKFGEEARVSLASFTLEGGAHKNERNILHRIEKEGFEFKVLPAGEIAPITPELKAISDEWLLEKNVREKRFSLGYFHEPYIERFPHALVVNQGRIIAFANLWQAADREELSIDLMRYRNNAPNGIMDFLFLNLMLWGKEQGFRWFNLGMAPLSGLERRVAAPLWNRVASLVFEHGEHFYNFQGLRQFKDKFDPVWTARYMAYPGALRLPQILANVASLISGGVAGIVRK